MSRHSVVCVLMYVCVVVNGNSVKREQAFYIYPKDGPTELYLPRCDLYANEACNIVQKRHFKLKVRVLRKCRCPQTCPIAPSLDNYSIQLDSHSYIKFCSPITSLETCKPRMAALEVHNHTIGNLTTISTRAVCNCPIQYPYWRESYHSYNNYFNGTIDSVHKYRCTEMKKCEEGDFCGYIRTDQYFMYYHCSCPMGTSCYYKDKTVHHIHVIMYTGPGYLAYCLPKSPQRRYIEDKSNNCT